MAPGGGDRLSLRLELNVGSEPISGRLVAADGTEENFAGWLELAAAIDKALENNERHMDKEAVT